MHANVMQYLALTFKTNCFRSLLSLFSVASFSSPALASSRIKLATLSLSSGHKSFRDTCFDCIPIDSSVKQP